MSWTLFSIEYFELLTLDDANKKYPGAKAEDWQIEFPVTAVEVTNVVANSDIEFNSKETKFGRGNIMKNCFSSNCGTCLAFS